MYMYVHVFMYSVCLYSHLGCELYCDDTSLCNVDRVNEGCSCVNTARDVCPCRAEGILNRGSVDAFSLEESQNLSIFFATNNSVTTHLKKQLEEVK